MALMKSLSTLKRKKEMIEQEGYVQNCWIETYRPAGTAKGNHLYCQLRSRKPLANGKCRRHLKPEEVAVFRKLIENGRKLKHIEREIAWLEGKKTAPRTVLSSSASDEWYTPPEYIELARLVMGKIDLDPASNDIAQAWIMATTCYMLHDNGLEMPWFGCVWLNPPYGAQVSLWTKKATETYEQGMIHEAMLLVRPAAGSHWYQELSSRFPACIPHKRIRFIDAKGTQQKSPVHGNVFFYLGNAVERFREIFSTIGVVTKPF